MTFDFGCLNVASSSMRARPLPEPATKSVILLVIPMWAIPYFINPVKACSARHAEERRVGTVVEAASTRALGGDYTFHRIARSSAGAILGAQIAAGMDRKQLETVMRSVDYVRLQDEGYVDHLGLQLLAGREPRS
jgi:hypothetical protein